MSLFKTLSPYRIITFGIAVIIAALLLWYLNVVWLGVFASILWAIFLWNIGRELRRFLPVSPLISVLITLGILLLLALALVGFAIPTLREQWSSFAGELPSSLTAVQEWLRMWGVSVRPAELWQQLSDSEWMAFVAPLTNVAATFVSAISGIVLVFFLGIFIAINPQPYIRGTLLLFPKDKHDRMANVLYEIGHSLWFWLLGRMTAMAAIAVITYIGLLVLGMPSPLLLAIIAGLFSFIPNFGPILSVLPALLVSFSVGGSMPLWVIGLYGLAQIIENNFITPFVQQKMISLPPAVIMTGQIAFAVLFKALGALLAVPLLVVFVILVQRLYIEDTLHRSVSK